MGRRFQKVVEDFVCMHCGAEVQGSGFTNHCPYCLWSRHVDVFPGDRAEQCRGAMEPVRTELKHGELILIHRCTSCGKEQRNKTAQNDNQELLYKLLNC